LPGRRWCRHGHRHDGVERAEIVSSGGATSNTLLAGGQETVLRSGHASGTIILSGGSELVSGGTAVATAISGGTLEVASGGISRPELSVSRQRRG
jgi:autotransporter passenger strand-loop-strand repeat protein